MDLSIIIPTYNEASSLALLIDKIRAASIVAADSYEIIVVDAGSCDDTLQIAQGKNVIAFAQKQRGYGIALKEAIKMAKGKYIITIDPDFSHNPFLIKRLFSQCEQAHIVIASRYIKGGLADMPALRKIISVILNRFLASGLSLEVKDITSGFRLYNREIFKEISLEEKNFSILAEILVKAYMNGFSIKEIPFHYHSNKVSRPHSKIFRFGFSFLFTFWKIWKTRNTIFSADYDERAFYSRIPMQRYWQRKKYQIISGFLGYPVLALDVGCGSGKILGAMPQAVGLDISFKKLRYNLKLGSPLVNADIKNLPFKDNVFELIICSEVIEHLKYDEQIFQELKRVLKNNGVLILATPDYSRITWLIIEWLYKKIVPGGYADEHITHYSRRSLKEIMEKFGFELESYKYILASDLICKFRKNS